MSRWNVSSFPCPRATYGESSTSASPRPRPSSTSHGPVIGPNSAASASGSAAARSATVPMPSEASFLAVFAPMPHSASVGRPPRTSNQLAYVSRNTPAGLPNPVAILACSLFSPIPTVQSSWVAARTAAASERAKPSGSEVSTPTNASSQPSTSTTAPEARSTSITVAETSSYAARSTGRNTASGRRFAAVRSGSPECTPCSPRRAWSGRRRRPPRRAVPAVRDGAAPRPPR